MYQNTSRLTALLFVAITLAIGARLVEAQTTPAKATALQAVERNKDEIAKVGDAFFSLAEIGMQEVETSKLAAKVFTDMGYNAERRPRNCIRRRSAEDIRRSCPRTPNRRWI